MAAVNLRENFERAVAEVTAPGGIFEIVEAGFEGRTYKVFKHAPPTLREIFDSCAAAGDIEFIIYEGERITFGDFYRRVSACASALVDRFAVQRGDRVAIAMRNHPEWVIAFGAITSIGAVSVSLNAWWSEDELTFGIEDSEPKLVFADGDRAQKLAPLCEARSIPLVVVRSGSERWLSFDDVVVLGADMPDQRPDPEDDATILYTSGTTGRPKGAVSRHRNITQAIMAYASRSETERLRASIQAAETSASTAGTDTATREQPPSRPPVFILIVPLFHVTGCIPVLMSCVFAKLKLVMMHRWDAGKALELIEAEHITQFVGVPTQAWDLMNHPRFSEFDTASLRGISGGGAPAPKALVARAVSNAPKSVPGIGYGMTETTAYGPQNSGPDYVAHPESTGRWMPVLEVEIRDPSGTVLADGNTGDIWLRSPSIVRGYWRNPDATAEAIVEGWLCTGDIGLIDDGLLYIKDRAKDMILRGGENVYCAEVEQAVYEFPGVAEAAVFGIPDPRLGERVALALLPRDGASIDVDALRSFLMERIAGFKVPESIVVLDEPLPRNAAGKFLKRELRELLGEGN